MSWEPPLSFEEKIKDLLIPPRVYLHFKARKEARKGEEELSLLPFLVDRARMSLDIGANKGVYSYFLSWLCWHVHAFEPNPKLYRVLSRGVGHNVTAHPIALANFSGTAELRVPRRSKGYSNQGSTLSAISAGEDYAAVQVRAARLDELGLTDIGFIKIDVEGFELEVLEGGAEILKCDRPNLLIELEQRHTRRPIMELIAQVEAYGYRCLALRQGTLITKDRLDPARDHRTPDDGRDYVFNFVFLPA